MAVYAAHLTRTLQGTPSIFEVTAQESLAATVKPAVRKVFEFLALYNPKRFNWLVNWYDEVYLLLNGVLQYHYLRHYAATFAESFYGLQRVPLHNQEFMDGFHLPPKLELLSMLWSVVFPYVRDKLENIAEQYRLDEADGVLGKTWKDICKVVYVRTYTALHFVYETTILVNYMAYLAGKARAHSPLLYATGLSLNYAHNIADDQEYSWTDLWSNLRKFNLGETKITFHMLGTALLRGMESGAFIVQFLKWWESSGQRTTSLSYLPVPPPPEKDETCKKLINKCPVCFQQWRIPTVLPVCGYVFCYKCITRCLKENSKCPVTNYPALPDDLIRLYLD